jgi:hypothetical protein
MFWLVVLLYTQEGEFVAKDIYETATKEQCVEFAGQVAKTIVNSKLQAQFDCMSDEEYRIDRRLDQ